MAHGADITGTGGSAGVRGASWGAAGSSEWCWSSQQVGRPALTLVVTGSQVKQSVGGTVPPQACALVIAIAGKTETAIWPSCVRAYYVGLFVCLILLTLKLYLKRIIFELH